MNTLKVSVVVMLLALVGMHFSLHAAELKDAGDFVYEISDSAQGVKICGAAKTVKEEITKITIPDSIDGIAVTQIDDDAFRGCINLTQVELNPSLVKIDDKAFAGCTSLTSLKCNDALTKIEDAAFFGCTALTSVELDASLRKIEEEAFRGCESLKQVVIPVTLVKIDIEKAAFAGCLSLPLSEQANIRNLGYKGSFIKAKK